VALVVSPLCDGLVVCSFCLGLGSYGFGFSPGARFTKYLTTILRLSYDNAEVTIDLRRTSNLRNILRMAQGFSQVRFTCKVVRSSETVFAN